MTCGRSAIGLWGSVTCMARADEVRVRVKELESELQRPRDEPNGVGGYTRLCAGPRKLSHRRPRVRRSSSAGQIHPKPSQQGAPSMRKPSVQTPEGIEGNAAENELPEAEVEAGNLTPIPKPSGFSLDKFKSKRPTSMTGVKTLLGALPHYPLVDAKDFVRLHPDEDEILVGRAVLRGRADLGMKKETLHLIDEDLHRAFTGRQEGHAPSLGVGYETVTTSSSWRTSRPPTSTTPGMIQLAGLSSWRRRNGCNWQA